MIESAVALLGPLLLLLTVENLLLVLVLAGCCRLAARLGPVWRRALVAVVTVKLAVPLFVAVPTARVDDAGLAAVASGLGAVAAPREPLAHAVAEAVVVLWLAGALAVIAYSVMQSIRLRRRLGRLEDVDPGELPGLDGSWGRVPVRQSGRVHSPMVLGVLRPRVVLPVHWRGWSAAARRLVLAHELAHIRRRDHLLCWVRTLALALNWHNPAAWWLAAQLDRASEMTCDDDAIEACGLSRVDYARELVAIAETLALASAVTPGPAMFRPPARRLAERLRHQLSPAVAGSGWRSPRAAAVLGGVLALAFSIAPAPVLSFDLASSANRSAAVQPPRPVGGYSSLADELAQIRRALRASGGNAEEDIRVRVALDHNGELVATRQVGQGCAGSYTAIETVLASVSWEPARRGPSRVAATVDLSFSPHG